MKSSIFAPFLIFMLTCSMFMIFSPKVHALSNPTIIGDGISYEEFSSRGTPPITQTPLGHMRLWFEVYNPNSVAMNIILGASISIGSNTYSDSSHDVTLSFGPGNTWANRYFYVQSGVPSGSYNVIFALWSSDWSTRYYIQTEYNWINMVNSVSVQLSSNFPNAGTITWDNSVYNLPTTIYTTTRVHWSGSDNIHCTPPSGCTFSQWQTTGAISCSSPSSTSTNVNVDGNGALTVVLQAPAPTLTNGYVTPLSGDTSTTFYYYVSYYDPTGFTPDTRCVIIDSGVQPMTLSSGTYSNGVYVYSTTLAAGSHNYYFRFTSSNRGYTIYLPLPSSPYSGPSVTALQLHLTVNTAHDTGNPRNGIWPYNNGQSIICTVTSPVTESGTVWTCTGWTGTGSVPSSGSGASTGPMRRGLSASDIRS